MMKDSTKRFSNRVDNYVKYRPSYPKEIIAWLTKKTGFSGDFIVADIGSGTGIFTQLLLENGNKVYAIEPNNEMRLKAEELLHESKLFNSINGTAENTGLQNTSVDFIIAAQAFHWFNSNKTKQEFLRIAKPNAYCVLIWNERQTTSSFEKDYEKLLIKFSVDYADVNHTNINKKTIGEFFKPSGFIMQSFSNKQVFDFDGLKGRLLSSSYIPDETQTVYPQMMKELQTIFNVHQINNAVEFVYETKVYSGKIN